MWVFEHFCEAFVDKWNGPFDLLPRAAWSNIKNVGGFINFHFLSETGSFFRN
jgi:hypothetical protein